jgi:hypothetical protein
MSIQPDANDELQVSREVLNTAESFQASINFPANPLLQLVPSCLPQAMARLQAMIWKKLHAVPRSM